MTRVTGAPMPALRPIVDGCRAHGVTSSEVARWWAIAEDTVGAHVGVCCCCGGPTAMHKAADGVTFEAAAYCRRCDEGRAQAAQVAAAAACTPRCGCKAVAA
jgi:hypothetical protein